MNLAWASHEIISDYLTPCLAWLEAGGQKPIDGFLRALQAGRGRASSPWSQPSFKRPGSCQEKRRKGGEPCSRGS